MPKVVDVEKVQKALDRVARNAKRGSSELRAGKLLVGRNAADGRFAMRNDKTAGQTTRRKK